MLTIVCVMWEPLVENLRKVCTFGVISHALEEAWVYQDAPALGDSNPVLTEWVGEKGVLLRVGPCMGLEHRAPAVDAQSKYRITEPKQVPMRSMLCMCKGKCGLTQQRVTKQQHGLCKTQL